MIWLSLDIESLMRLAFLVDRAWPRTSAFYCFHCARYAVNRARPIIAINFTLDLLKRLCSRLLYRIAYDEKKNEGKKNSVIQFCPILWNKRGRIKIMKFNSIRKLKRKIERLKERKIGRKLREEEWIIKLIDVSSWKKKKKKGELSASIELQTRILMISLGIISGTRQKVTISPGRRDNRNRYARKRK